VGPRLSFGVRAQTVRYHYRITKYDPTFRGDDGAYKKDEWTAYSDIGRTFSGKKLSEAEYLETESSYLSALSEFLSEARLPTVTVRGLENARGFTIPRFISEGNEITIAQCVDFARLALREVIWGRLVRPGRAYVHFGYDYYMYIGLNSKCSSAVARAQERGLFVEPFRSPYLRALADHC